MLTLDFDRLRIGPGTKVIDVGCGAGRHAFEAYRRGADVIAFDQDASQLEGVAALLGAMAAQGEAPATATARTVVGDALELPYAESTFDCAIASEILEHVPHDDAAIAELVRVLRPGGTLAVSVPRWFPERVCWWLSEEYHSNEGGHVRIYRADQLRDKIARCGMSLAHSHHAHALHSPFWWLKCAVGVSREQHPLVTAYHKLLVWDLMRRPAATRIAERLLNPVVGKSVAMYFDKPADFDKPAAAPEGTAQQSVRGLA